MDACAIPLRAAALEVAVPGRRLVAQLTFEVRAGQVIVLLGPNGSGKTLCLLTLAGLRPAAGGRVLLDDKAIESLPRRAVARTLGFMPQDSGADIVGTVRDFVALGLYPSHSPGSPFPATTAGDEARIDAALQRLGLGHCASQDVASLSGGERRRLDLALLCAQQARLWLLDEPTNHLDPAQQVILLGLLRQHTGSGGAVVLSLHDPSLAAQIADAVVLLHGDGRWQFGTPEQLLTAAELSALYGTNLTLAPRLGPALPP